MKIDKKEMENFVKLLSERIISMFRRKKNQETFTYNYQFVDIKTDQKGTKTVKISLFNDDGAIGSIYLITDGDYSYIAKLQKCDIPENKTESKVIVKASGYTKRGVPHLPTVYDYYQGKEYCIIYMKKAEDTIKNYFQLLDEYDDRELIRSLLKQMFISLYIFHKYINYYHCDAGAYNFFYFKVPEEPKCWEYKLPFGSYQIKNDGIEVAIHDFGGSLRMLDKIPEDAKLKRKYSQCNIASDYEMAYMEIIDKDTFDIGEVIDEVEGKKSGDILKEILDKLSFGEDQMTGCELRTIA